MNNSPLMKACGSKTGRYDPESPEQTLYVLRHGEGEEKFLAWVKTKTVFMSRSPYCVGEDGTPLYIESAAADNNWSLRTAENYAYKLKAQGRIRLKDKRIWYRADVPKNASRDGDSDQPTDSTDTEIDFVQSHFSPYLADFIKGLPEEKRASAKTSLEAYLQWKRKFFAEGEAALRAIAEQVEDNTYRAIGVPKKRLPKRRPVNTEYLQLSLKLEPDFVPSHNGNGTAESVQTAKSSSYKPENGSVQTDASLLCSSDSDSDSDTSSSSLRSSVAQSETTTSTTTPHTPASNENEDIEYLTERMEFERDAAAQLLRACRAEDPSISVKVITRLAGHKQQQVAARIRSGDIGNIPGFMISAVPKMVHQPIRKTIEAQLLSERTRAAGGD